MVASITAVAKDPNGNDVPFHGPTGSVRTVHTASPGEDHLFFRVSVVWNVPIDCRVYFLAAKT